jgi:hypothetical protein
LDEYDDLINLNATAEALKRQMATVRKTLRQYVEQADPDVVAAVRSKLGYSDGAHPVELGAVPAEWSDEQPCRLRGSCSMPPTPRHLTITTHIPLSLKLPPRAILPRTLLCAARLTTELQTPN